MGSGRGFGSVTVRGMASRPLATNAKERGTVCYMASWTRSVLVEGIVVRVGGSGIIRVGPKILEIFSIVTP